MFNSLLERIVFPFQSLLTILASRITVWNLWDPHLLLQMMVASQVKSNKGLDLCCFYTFATQLIRRLIFYHHPNHRTFMQLICEIWIVNIMEFFFISDQYFNMYIDTPCLSTPVKCNESLYLVSQEYSFRVPFMRFQKPLKFNFTSFNSKL